MGKFVAMQTMGTSIVSGGTAQHWTRAITKDQSRHSREAIMSLVAGVVDEQLDVVVTLSWILALIVGAFEVSARKSAGIPPSPMASS
jgi:hypothetical protein